MNQPTIINTDARLDHSGRAFHKVDEVSQILRVSVCTVYRLIASRRLASIKVGGTLLVRATDLQQFVEQNRTTPIWEELQ